MKLIYCMIFKHNKYLFADIFSIQIENNVLKDGLVFDVVRCTTDRL